MSDNARIIPYVLEPGEPEGQLVRVSKADLEQLIQERNAFQHDLQYAAETAMAVMSRIEDLGVKIGEEMEMPALMGLLTKKKQINDLKEFVNQHWPALMAMLEKYGLQPTEQSNG